MSRALDTAIAKLATLPADEQDRIAQWLLEELRDEEHWARQFAASQSTLSRLAAEARAELAAGRATELDPDKLGDRAQRRASGRRIASCPLTSEVSRRKRIGCSERTPGIRASTSRRFTSATQSTPLA